MATRMGKFLSCGIGIACFSATSPMQAKPPEPLSKPNILWITVEDMSADLGCYGDSVARTPNIDKLASEGRRYTNVFTVTPVCAPSRSCLITGAYPTTIGTQHMRSRAVPPSWVKCFPETLRAEGYYCTNNVKTDYNFPPPRTAWDENSKRAHWRNRPPGMPFFSVFNLTTTHESKFHMTEEEITALPDIPAQRTRPEDVKLPPYYPDTPIVRADYARYYDIIAAMDTQVERILAELKEDGLSTNTIVFYFSDHGRGLPRGKRWSYDSGLHVPLIIRWPERLKPGTTSDDLISFIDFAPTMLALVGAPANKHLVGRDFLVSPPAAREFVFANRDRMDSTNDRIRAVRDKRYKYIRNFEPEKPYAQIVAYGEKTPTMKELRRLNEDGQLTGPQKLFFRPTKPEEELYDTLADPHEINDLTSSPEHQAIRLRMRKALEEWQRDTKDLGYLPESELKEKMRPGGEEIATDEPVVAFKAGTSKGELQAMISCPTEGASIAYRTSADRRENPKHWLLYTGPFTVEKGTSVTAVACRIGYTDSKQVTVIAEK